jgi:hypothetical protein
MQTTWSGNGKIAKLFLRATMPDPELPDLPRRRVQTGGVTKQKLFDTNFWLH